MPTTSTEQDIAYRNRALVADLTRFLDLINRDNRPAAWRTYRDTAAAQMDAYGLNGRAGHLRELALLGDKLGITNDEQALGHLKAYIAETIEVLTKGWIEVAA